MSDASQKYSILAIAGLLLICVIVGALAGTIASVFTQESLRQYVESLTRRESLGRLSEVQPRALPGTYEEALTRVMDQALPSIAVLRTASLDALSPQGWVTEEGIVASGVVVTSDGWILVSAGALANWSYPVTEAEVWVTGKRYAIDQTLTDPLTDLALIKVTGANLPAIAFGDAAEVRAGQIAFGMFSSTIVPTSVVRTDVPIDTLLPAEAYATRWLLQEEIGSSFVANASGEMIAFGTGSGEAIPMDHILPFIQSVIRQKSVSYAGLGVRVADISVVPNLPMEAKMGRIDGALVIAADRVSSVLKGSPAAQAGIKPYDLIVAVNDIPVSHESPLSLLLKSYEEGERVRLSVVRADTQMDIQVVLGSYADLIY